MFCAHAVVYIAILVHQHCHNRNSVNGGCGDLLWCTTMVVLHMCKCIFRSSSSPYINVMSNPWVLIIADIDGVIWREMNGRKWKIVFFFLNFFFYFWVRSFLIIRRNEIEVIKEPNLLCFTALSKGTGQSLFNIKLYQKKLYVLFFWGQIICDLIRNWNVKCYSSLFSLRPYFHM